MRWWRALLPTGGDFRTAVNVMSVAAFRVGRVGPP